MAGAVFSGGCKQASIRGPEPRQSGPESAWKLNAVIYLVGDGGDVKDSSPLLTALRQDVASMMTANDSLPAARFLVGYLGDNVYESGIRGDSAEREQDSTVLAALVRPLAGGNGRGLVLPGNHEWDQGRDRSTQERFRQVLERIAADQNATASVVPNIGCPGPWITDVGDYVRLIYADTHAWLRERWDGCPDASDESALARVGSGIAGAGSRQVVMLAHHPLRSGGGHGGTYGNGALGRLQRLAHRAGLLGQDLSAPPYRNLIHNLEETFAATARPLAFAAGHDHSLQVIEGLGPREPRYHLVSGGASKLSDVAALPNTLFWRSRADQQIGYMRIEVYRTTGNPRFHLTVIAGPEEQCEDPNGRATCLRETASRFRTVYSMPLQ